MMQIIGNIVLALAAFLYVLPLQMLMQDVGRRKDDGGALWGAIFVLVPLWLLLTIALMLATGRGGFDWLSLKRGSQYCLAFATGVSLLVVTFFSFMAKAEHANHIPWAARVFANWAVYVFPLFAFGFALVTLNPSLGSNLPALAYRAPLAIISVASLLACVGMIGQWIIYSQQQQLARVERAVAEGNKRDRDIMERVQSLNPTNDFAELLGFANRFENPEIRELAIQKAQSRTDFVPALHEVMTTWRAESALVYLDACDLPDADMKALGEPFLTAIAELTKQAEDAVARTHTFYAEQFDWNTRIILSVADRLNTQGVDSLAAIGKFRMTLDAPRGKNFDFNARRTLDACLAERLKQRTK